MREAGVVGALVEIVLTSDNSMLQQHAAMSISSLAIDEKDAEYIFNLGGLFAMLSLLSSQNEVLQYAAVLAVANLSRNVTCRDAIVASDSLPVLGTSLLFVLFRHFSVLTINLVSLLKKSVAKCCQKQHRAEDDEDDLILQQLLLALYNIAYSPAMQDRYWVCLTLKH